MTNSFLNLQIWKLKRLNISGTEYKPTKDQLKSPLRYFMYLILAKIHFHIFSLVHQIRKEINTLKEEETLFETNLRGNKPSPCETVLVNNLLEYLLQSLVVWGSRFQKLFHSHKFKMKTKCSFTLAFPYFTCPHIILLAREHEYSFSKCSRDLNISKIFWACYTKNIIGALTLFHFNVFEKGLICLASPSNRL